jgi:hypothetical protein
MISSEKLSKLISIIGEVNTNSLMAKVDQERAKMIQDAMPFKTELFYPISSSTSSSNRCDYCGQKIYMAYDHCTHCGAPTP